jgi:hypothetical protein
MGDGDVAWGHLGRLIGIGSGIIYREIPPCFGRALKYDFILFAQFFYPTFQCSLRQIQGGFNLPGFFELSQLPELPV